MQELVAGRVYPFRMMYWLSAVLGTVGLLLTVSGIYGVLSYLVAQRVREIGIRMALGATTRSVAGLALKQSLRLAALGITIGGAMALGASRLLASALVVIRAFDITAYGGAILLVLAVSPGPRRDEEVPSGSGYQMTKRKARAVRYCVPPMPTGSDRW